MKRSKLWTAELLGRIDVKPRQGARVIIVYDRRRLRLGHRLAKFVFVGALNIDELERRRTL
jgi:hypothetical protein